MVSMQTKNWANISSHPSMSSEKSFTYTIGPDEKENIDSNRGLSVKLEMEERIKTDGSLEKEPIDEGEETKYTLETPRHYLYPSVEFEKQYKNTSKLPILKICVPLSMDPLLIHKTFRVVAKSQNFQVIEEDENSGTAVLKNDFNIIKFCCCCFNSTENKEAVSAVKMQITVSEKACVRRIRVRGLYGNRNKIHKFLKKIGRLLKLRKTELQGVNGERESTGSTPEAQGKATEPIHQTEGSDEESREEGAQYTFHKILSSENYSLGKNVSIYLSTFPQQYKNIQESAALLPQPLEGVVLLINDTVRSFFHQYNYGKSETKQLMHYCRPAVEKYIFPKIYERLFAMYKYKNKEIDYNFVSKRKLLQKYTPMHIINALGIREEFVFKEELNFTASFSIENLAITPREGEITKREIMPYYESIKTLNKLELTTMPREKLLILRQAYSHMKTAVVDHWKGKKELLAMDDQLPLLIYVLSMSTVTHPAAQFHFLEDYLRMQNKGFDSEPMLIANLQASLQYIAENWDISTIGEIPELERE